MNRILFGCFAGQPFVVLVFQTWTSVGEGGAIYRGLTCLLVGVPLAMLSERISLWMITLPSDACPGCGYLRSIAGSSSGAAAGAVQSTRCPECGLDGFVSVAADSKTHDGEVSSSL